MKKIIGFMLSMVMLFANIVPTYADTVSDKLTQKVVFDAINATFEQIDSEVVGDGYTEKYEKTYAKFLENLKNGANINYDIDAKYNETGDMSIKFDYNDDGKSLIINLELTSDDKLFGEFDEPLKATVYLDDEKIVINSLIFAQQSLVYYFGDDTQSEYFTSKDAEYFKYSNIKNYINILTELQTSGELEKICQDYYNNLVVYLAKSEITKDGNDVTIKIDAQLIQDYLFQLRDKIESDDDLKALFAKFGVDYGIVGAYLSDEVNTLAQNVNPTAQILYNGQISNGLLVNNKFTISIEDKSVDFTINFNDSKTSLLSDCEFIANIDDVITKADFSLKNNGTSKNFKMKCTVDGELAYDYDVTYSINGLDVTTKANIKIYTEPYFYTTEEPAYPVADTFEDWNNEYISNVESNIYENEASLGFANNEIQKVNDSIKAGTQADITLDRYSGDYDYFFMYIDYILEEDSSKFIDDNDKIINVDEFLKALNSYKAYCEKELSDSKLAKEEYLKNPRVRYDEYVKDFNENSWYLDWYNEELANYKEYQEYLKNGEQKDVMEIISATHQLLSENQLVTENSTQSLENGVESSSNTGVMTIRQSQGKNSIDVSNAISLIDFMNQ